MKDRSRRKIVDGLWSDTLSGGTARISILRPNFAHWSRLEDVLIVWHNVMSMTFFAYALNGRHRYYGHKNWLGSLKRHVCRFLQRFWLYYIT